MDLDHSESIIRRDYNLASDSRTYDETDRQVVGRADRWTWRGSKGWTDGQKDGGKDGRMDQRMDGRTNERTNERSDGRRERRTE